MYSLANCSNLSKLLTLKSQGKALHCLLKREDRKSDRQADNQTDRSSRQKCTDRQTGRQPQTDREVAGRQPDMSKCKGIITIL